MSILSSEAKSLYSACVAPSTTKNKTNYEQTMLCGNIRSNFNYFNNNNNNNDNNNNNNNTLIIFSPYGAFQG